MIAAKRASLSSDSSCWDFVAAGGIVFHKHMYFICSSDNAPMHKVTA